MARIGPYFARIQPRLQARKYIDALASDLAKRNSWTIAEHIGDRTPDRCQRLLNHAVWDTLAVMSEVRRFAVEGLDLAARGKGLRIGALDETGQQKKGTATAGVKRQHLGCAGGVDNGINTVPTRAKTMGLPADLKFRTKGELAIDILSDAYAEGRRTCRSSSLPRTSTCGACPLRSPRTALRWRRSAKTSWASWPASAARTGSFRCTRRWSGRRCRDRRWGRTTGTRICANPCVSPLRCRAILTWPWSKVGQVCWWMSSFLMVALNDSAMPGGA
jgi:hypothetical protein